MVSGVFEVGIFFGKQKMLTNAKKNTTSLYGGAVYKYNFLCDRMYDFVVTCGYPINLMLFLRGEVTQKWVTRGVTTPKRVTRG